MRLFFSNKKLNEKIQNREINTYLTQEELSKTDLIIFFFKNYNFELSNKVKLNQKKIKYFKKKCYQPILLKYLIFGKKCNENLEIYFYENK